VNIANGLGEDCLEVVVLELGLIGLDRL
jgi:hypothetical protein